MREYGDARGAISMGPQETCPVVETAGRIVKASRLGEFSILESLYAEGMELTRHAHDHAYLSFILDGWYTERYCGSDSVCRTKSLRFLPAGKIHENTYASATRCLLIELDSRFLERLKEHASVPERPGEIHGIASTWLANRIYQEFREQDSAAALAMEGLVLEILAEGTRSLSSRSSGPVPQWLRRTRDFLESQFFEKFTLDAAAAVAGVHKVHLAREFRRHYHCTPGEFVRRRRVEHAFHLLAHSEMTLAAIAYACGFADQSHFTGVFKRHAGITPAKFREAASLQQGP